VAYGGNEPKFVGEQCQERTVIHTCKEDATNVTKFKCNVNEI